MKKSVGKKSVGKKSVVKKSDSWGLAIAALTLGVLAILVAVAFYFGIRGLL